MNNAVNTSRRNLLKSVALGAAAAGTLPISTLASAQVSKEKKVKSAKPSSARFWLTNLTLETGFAYNAKNQVEKTLTGRFDLLIHQGKVEKIADKAPKDGIARHDMKGALLSPSFTDWHMHIDKSHYAQPWKAVEPFVSIQGRIEEEQKLLPTKLATATAQAQALLALMTGFGTTDFRIQCNVDPTIGTQNVEKIKAALDSYQDKIAYEMVAFPQHGTLTPGVLSLMDQAMKDGCTIVGGLDPATIDKNVDGSLTGVFDLAVKHKAGVDIHLHNTGQVGADTISRICYFTKEAKLEGKVAVSHAFALGSVPPEALEKVLLEVQDAKVSIISTVPIGGPMPSPDDLAAKGIPLYLGQDSINDMWSPFGTGNMLERASLLAQRFRYVDEYRLNRALRYITQGITPLNQKGEQVWPKVGDAADFVMTNASCTAEMVARRSDLIASMKRGKAVVWKL